MLRLFYLRKITKEWYKEMVKIDTKEYFRIFHLSEVETTAKMTGTLKEELLQKRDENPGHAIVVLPETETFSPSFFSVLEEVQSTYFSHYLSFIITPVSGKLKKKYPVLEKIHHAPTLQESIDVVMMEKIERELQGPDEADLP